MENTNLETIKKTVNQYIDDFVEDDTLNYHYKSKIENSSTIEDVMYWYDRVKEMQSNTLKNEECIIM